jgi:hypothetical protein
LPQVATKRVKHAIKSEIPSITDPINKLNHVGKATQDKLTDVRRSARSENLGELNVSCKSLILK